MGGQVYLDNCRFNQNTAANQRDISVDLSVQPKYVISDKNDPGYSIIIPVYNEEALIQWNSLRLLSYLENLVLKYPFEILIVSNGSVDGTCSLGRDLSRRHEKIRFFHTDRKGAGIAFRIAAQEAKYENLISVDMDLSVELDFIRKAIFLLDTYQMVIGSKKAGVQRRSVIRKIPSMVFIMLTQMLLGISYTDYSLAAKAYKKNFVLKNRKVIDAGTSYVISLAYIAQQSGLSIKEIPVFCDDKRKSRFNLLHEISYRFSRLIGTWWDLRVIGY